MDIIFYVMCVSCCAEMSHLYCLRHFFRNNQYSVFRTVTFSGFELIDDGDDDNL